MIAYHDKIITHGGQTTVEGFGAEIRNNAEEIQRVADRARLEGKELIVIWGFHGTHNGAWARNFDEVEQQDSEDIAVAFNHIQMVRYTNNDEPNGGGIAIGNIALIEINLLLENNPHEYYFLTWCDSESWYNDLD